MKKKILLSLSNFNIFIFPKDNKNNNMNGRATANYYICAPFKKFCFVDSIFTLALISFCYRSFTEKSRLWPLKGDQHESAYVIWMQSTRWVWIQVISEKWAQVFFLSKWHYPTHTHTHAIIIIKSVKKKFDLQVNNYFMYKNIK